LSALEALYKEGLLYICFIMPIPSQRPTRTAHSHVEWA